jgi:hypothetical protein
MKRAFAIAVVAELVFVVVLLNSTIKHFIGTHPWWHSCLIAVPPIALLILAYFVLRNSGEENVLRTQSNALRAEAIVLQGRITYLTTQLEAERNKHP